jgi:UDPglucose 6-dehydrogenase
MSVCMKMRSNAFLRKAAEVHASDREGIAKAKAQFTQFAYFTNPYTAARKVRAAIICTDWDIFKTLDWRRIGKLMTRHW